MMPDGLRAGRRKLDGSNSPRHILLRKTSRFAGRFYCAMLKFVKIWYIIDKAWCDWNISVGGEKCRLKNRRTDLKLV